MKIPQWAPPNKERSVVGKVIGYTEGQVQIRLDDGTVAIAEVNGIEDPKTIIGMDVSIYFKDEEFWAGWKPRCEYTGFSFNRSFR